MIKNKPTSGNASELLILPFFFLASMVWFPIGYLLTVGLSVFALLPAVLLFIVTGAYIFLGRFVLATLLIGALAALLWVYIKAFKWLAAWAKNLPGYQGIRTDM